MEKILAEAKAMSEREEKFEKMLRDARKQYAEICAKMEKLRAEDRTKSAAFRELLAKNCFCRTCCPCTGLRKKARVEYEKTVI